MRIRVKHLKYIVSISIAILFSLVISGIVLAWNYDEEGFVFENGVDPLYYQFYSGTSQDTKDAFTMGAYYWETASDSPVNYEYTTGIYVDVYCYEVYAPNWPSVSGHCMHENDQSLCYLNTYVTASWYAGKRISTAGHELGHAIGHGENDNMLMDHDDDWRWDVLGIEEPTYFDIYYTNQLYD
jgi:hypothetical protein